ncbi:MAG: hypothetical protein GX992_01320 [Clostridium sp.]|nr:hypothetical protein [Clostridium sp.]
MAFLKILMFFLLFTGVVVVFAAKPIVRKFGLNERTKCNLKNEMTREEIENYKFAKAVLSIKMIGMLIELPGLILLFVIYR